MPKSDLFRLQQFFSVLFPLKEGLVEIRPFHATGGLARDKRAFLLVADKAELARYVLSLGKHLHVYFGVCTRTEEASRSQQGTGQFLAQFPALWADLDSKVLGDLAAARKALKRYPFPPSILVFTGHGYHAYWVLDTAVSISETERVRLEGGLRALQVDLFGVDNVSDLARILRVPYTYNVKDQNHPVLVKVVSLRAKRYPLEELLEPLSWKTTLTHNHYRSQGLTEARYEGIAAVMESDFITYCRKHAKTLSEPLWYAMITNLIGFRGGRRAIHLLSQPHPNYSFEETEEKIAHALYAAPGPHSYRYIADHGFRSRDLTEESLVSPASRASVGRGPPFNESIKGPSGPSKGGECHGLYPGT